MNAPYLLLLAAVALFVAAGLVALGVVVGNATALSFFGLACFAAASVGRHP